MKSKGAWKLKIQVNIFPFKSTHNFIRIPIRTVHPGVPLKRNFTRRNFIRKTQNKCRAENCDFSHTRKPSLKESCEWGRSISLGREGGVYSLEGEDTISFVFDAMVVR